MDSLELPTQITVDGLRSPDGLIEYLGQATKQPNGKYACLANVGGALALVEVTITKRTSQTKE